MKKIEAIVRKEMFPQIDDALKKIGLGGLSFFDVEGRGRAKGEEMVEGRGARTYRPEYIERVKIEIIVKDADADKVVETIREKAKTGAVGDGKIFVTTVEDVFDITSSESGEKAV